MPRWTFSSSTAWNEFHWRTKSLSRAFMACQDRSSLEYFGMSRLSRQISVTILRPSPTVVSFKYGVLKGNRMRDYSELYRRVRTVVYTGTLAALAIYFAFRHF